MNSKYGHHRECQYHWTNSSKPFHQWNSQDFEFKGLSIKYKQIEYGLMIISFYFCKNCLLIFLSWSVKLFALIHGGRPRIWREKESRIWSCLGTYPIHTQFIACLSINLCSVGFKSKPMAYYAPQKIINRSQASLLKKESLKMVQKQSFLMMVNFFKRKKKNRDRFSFFLISLRKSSKISSQ